MNFSIANSVSAETVLVQALLDAPMFDARWRWDATIALAVQRMRNGKRLPAQWQRNQAEDLVSVVFPDQIACAENLAGAREIPDHPLVRQTIDDCLRDTMDVDGLVNLLERLAEGDIEVHCADLTGPSPLSREIINARPYAFLDDGEAEDRRTRAISSEPDDLGRADTLRIISVEATRRVREEAWIRPRDADELHDGLLQLGYLAEDEYRSGTSVTGAAGNATRWGAWFESLADEHRACRVNWGNGQNAWVASERLAEVLAVHPDASCIPDIRDPAPADQSPDRDAALLSLLRDRLAGLGPVTVPVLGESLGISSAETARTLEVLRGEGYAIRMENTDEWCERRLLARIHRYSRDNRRKSVTTVTPEVFARFLAHWHTLDEPGDLDHALGLLEGWSAPVGAWENALLRCRSHDHDIAALDQRFLSGQLAWFRPLAVSGDKPKMVQSSPIALVPRGTMHDWRSVTVTGNQCSENTKGYEDNLIHILENGGAMFMGDIEQASGLLRPQLEDALKSLVYQGRVTADAFSPLRWLLRPEQQKRREEKRRRGPQGQGAWPVGRWSLLPGADIVDEMPAARRQQQLAVICQALLRRYGVVFRAILVRESLLPPWRDLLRYLRRMEDRGEVRGGRFVDGFSGEQFALPEALGLLKQSRVPASRASIAVVNATDPLNLGGYLVPGPRTPAMESNRVLLQDGLPVARLLNGEVERLAGISTSTQRVADDLLRVVTPWRRAR